MYESGSIRLVVDVLADILPAWPVHAYIHTYTYMQLHTTVHEQENACTYYRNSTYVQYGTGLDRVATPNRCRQNQQRSRSGPARLHFRVSVPRPSHLSHLHRGIRAFPRIVVRDTCYARSSPVRSSLAGVRCAVPVMVRQGRRISPKRPFAFSLLS